jgi:hypothetical protein
MVKDGAQLYTMEGIAAGLIMLLTTYLVLGSTSVYTPGDTHLTDMQLEQVGSDILKIMDTPRNLTNSLKPNQSDLGLMVNTTDQQGFNASFLGMYLNNPNIAADATKSGSTRIQIKATVWFRNQSSLQSYQLYAPSGNLGNFSAREPGVRVTRLVHLSGKPTGLDPAISPNVKNRPQEVLVEVLMWEV